MLDIIAKTVGTDVETLVAFARPAGLLDSVDATGSFNAMLLFRMIRAFQSLGDDETRLSALQYVEMLAVPKR